MWIDIALIVFSLLIVLSILDYVRPNLKEGATGGCDLSKDPTYLAKVNAADIKGMKDDIGEVKKLKEDIVILTNLVSNNAKSIQKMGDELKAKSDELTGGWNSESGEDLPSASGLA